MPRIKPTQESADMILPTAAKTPKRKPVKPAVDKAALAKAVAVSGTASAPKGGKPRVIELPPIEEIVALVHIKGETNLILNPFTAQVIQQLLDAQAGKKAQKKAKSVDDEMAKRIQKLPSGKIGFSALAFKKAMISATLSFKGLKTAHVKQGCFIDPDGHDENGCPLIELTTSKPEALKAHVKNQTGVADIRVRPMVSKWSCTLRMTITPSILSLEAALSVLRVAGRSVGVGDWRPERSGDYGRFAIEKVEVLG